MERDTDTMVAEHNARRIAQWADDILRTSAETTRLLLGVLAESVVILADIQGIDRSGPYTRPETRTR